MQRLLCLREAALAGREVVLGGRANMARISQSRPDSGIAFLIKVLTTF